MTVGFHILLFSFAALHYPAKRLRRESDITAQFLTVFSLALPEFLPAGSTLQQKTQYVNTAFSIRLPLYRISVREKTIAARQKTAVQTFSEN